MFFQEKQKDIQIILNWKDSKNHNNLEQYINNYLLEIYKESLKRGYNFNKTKIGDIAELEPLNVTDGQLNYEFQHLQNKLKTRDFNKYRENTASGNPESNSIFRIVKGPIEKWEKNTD